MNWVVCSCCGDSIRNTEDENVSLGELPYPHDEGFGMCVSCGGDKRSTGDDEESVKRRLGRSGTMFYEARFEVLASRLSPVNAVKFDKMSYAQKVRTVAGLITRGAMI